MTHKNNRQHQAAWVERQKSKGFEAMQLQFPKRLKLRIKQRALALGVTASELVRLGMDEFLKGKA
jgi:hypothetical protein